MSWWDRSFGGENMWAWKISDNEVGGYWSYEVEELRFERENW